MKHEWSRVRDLPQEEQKEFEKWLNNQTRPMFTAGSHRVNSEQDGYFDWDYARWKCHKSGYGVAWD